MNATIRSDPWLRVRSAPSLSAPVVGVLPDGFGFNFDKLLRTPQGVPEWAVIPATVDGMLLKTESGEPINWYINAHWLEFPEGSAFAPAGVAQVPYVSQIGNIYGLDCGPACWTMLARYCGVDTQLDTLIRLMGVENRLTGPEQGIACWRRLGLKVMQGEAITAWPHMSLVRYPALPQVYDRSFTGLHFIVVLGMDNQQRVVYHDPCWPDAASGAYRTMTLAQFMAAEVSVASRAACTR